MTTTLAPASALPAATITPRDVAFDVDAARIADWAGGDRIKTAYFNALSLLFPIGERFFIASVTAFRGAVTDPVLARDVKAFVTQEAMHTREHLAYNDLMRPIVDVDATDARQQGQMKYLRDHVSPIAHLAITCALEHFTAIMAHELLRNPEYLAGAEPSFARLWRWHALEECEHKSVAYDVYQAATEGRGDRTRRLTMLTVTLNFTFDTLWNAALFFKKSGTNTPATWLKLAWFLLAKPGFLRRLLPAYVRYYRRDFHPSQIDDRAERERVLASMGV